MQSLAKTAVVKFVGVAVAGRRPGEAGMIGWLLQTNAQMMIECAKILLDRQELRLRRSTRCC